MLTTKLLPRHHSLVSRVSSQCWLSIGAVPQGTSSVIRGSAPYGGKLTRRFTARSSRGMRARVREPRSSRALLNMVLASRLGTHPRCPRPSYLFDRWPAPERPTLQAMSYISAASPTACRLPQLPCSACPPSQTILTSALHVAVVTASWREPSSSIPPSCMAHKEGTADASLDARATPAPAHTVHALMYI